MNNVVRFSEAARLYAEHAAVVELMQRELHKGIASFLDAVRSALHSMVAPETLREKQTGAYRYWWLADEADDMENHPLLWFEARRPAIVHPGHLAMTACAPRASAAERARYVALSKGPPLAQYCKSGKGGTWSLFTFTVTYTDGDPVEQVAEPISQLLRSLRHTERALADGR
jgi:hypothetical protein